MKKIIRTTAFALVAALLLGGITGCKKKDDESTLKGDEYSASSSLQMTDAQAESLANSMTVKLYYPTNDKTGLVTENVLIEYTQKEKKTSKLVMTIIENMIAGPKNTASAVNLFPEGTTVESVKIQGGCAKISFNRTFGEKMNLSKEETMLFIQSIVNTVTEIKDIDSVKFVCAGDEMGTLTNGVDLNVSFKRDQNRVIGTSAEVSADAADNPYAEKYYMDVPLE